MAKWPKSQPHYDGERKVFNLDNGYIISLVKYTGSYGYKKNQWELAIIDEDTQSFVEPQDEMLQEILSEYNKADEGIYGYLDDPDADRIIEAVRRIDADKIRTECS